MTENLPYQFRAANYQLRREVRFHWHWSLAGCRSELLIPGSLRDLKSKFSTTTYMFPGRLTVTEPEQAYLRNQVADRKRREAVHEYLGNLIRLPVRGNQSC